MPDLAVLLNRCRAGDALAWEALVRQFQSRIYALAYYYVRDSEEARDLAQEIFIRIFKGLNTCQNAQTFVPWMLTMGRNCCIDRLRHLKRQPSTHRGPAQEQEPDGHQPNPEEVMETGARKQLIYRALEKVSLQSREIILLKEIQGLKIREIAQMLELPLGTVKSRSGRARLELAKAVVALDPGYGSRV